MRTISDRSASGWGPRPRCRFPASSKVAMPTTSALNSRSGQQLMNASRAASTITDVSGASRQARNTSPDGSSQEHLRSDSPADAESSGRPFRPTPSARSVTNVSIRGRAHARRHDRPADDLDPGVSRVELRARTPTPCRQSGVFGCSGCADLAAGRPVSSRDMPLRTPANDADGTVIMAVPGPVAMRRQVRWRGRMGSRGCRRR